MSTYRPFLLERYFAIHEFKAKYILCGSDGQSLSIKDVLSMNDNDAKSRELVNDLWYKMKLGYTESQGSPLLRQEISKMYNDEYSKVNSIKSDDLLIITPQEGIYIAMKCLLSPNDSIIVLSPSYQSLYENAKAINVNIIKWKFRLNKSSKNWYLDYNELENILIKQNNKNIKMIVINFPHNPTGYIPTIDEYQKIISIAKKYNIIVFSDEMYWFLFNNKSPLKSAVFMDNNYSNIISLCGMSKTFCMPGVRIGWLMTRNKRFMERFQNFKDYLTICSSAPSEVLSILALRNGNYLKIIERLKEIMNVNKKVLYEFVERNKDIFYWTQYDDDNHCGGLTKFIGYKMIQKSNGLMMNVQEFCDYIVGECGVMLLPSTMVEYQDDDGLEFIRFGLGRMNMKEGLGVLDKYLSKWRQNGFKVEVLPKL